MDRNGQRANVRNRPIHLAFMKPEAIVHVATTAASCIHAELVVVHLRDAGEAEVDRLRHAGEAEAGPHTVLILNHPHIAQDLTATAAPAAAGLDRGHLCRAGRFRPAGEEPLDRHLGSDDATHARHKGNDW